MAVQAQSVKIMLFSTRSIDSTHTMEEPYSLCESQELIQGQLCHLSVKVNSPRLCEKEKRKKKKNIDVIDRQRDLNKQKHKQNKKQCWFEKPTVCMIVSLGILLIYQ